MHKAITALLIIALCFSLHQLWLTTSKLNLLYDENAKLRLASASLVNNIEALKNNQLNQHKINVETGPSSTTSPALNTESDEANSGLSEKRTRYAELMSSASAWTVNKRIDEIAKLVTLTAEQKEKLKEKFEQDVKNEQESYFDEVEDDAERRSNLEANWLNEILGAELAQEFKTRRAELLRREQEQERDIEVFKLSKVLQLNTEQESYLRTALQETNQALQPLRLEHKLKMKTLFKKLHSSDASADKTEVSYEDISKLNTELHNKENELLNSKIKTALSDEQFNALLAYQSQAE